MHRDETRYLALCLHAGCCSSSYRRQTTVALNQNSVDGNYQNHLIPADVFVSESDIGGGERGAWRDQPAERKQAIHTAGRAKPAHGNETSRSGVVTMVLEAGSAVAAAIILPP